MSKIVTVAFLLVLLLAPSAAHAKPRGVDPVFPRGLPHAISKKSCVTGVGRCVWDARHQGRGKSAIITRYRGGFIVKRISHKRAHRLQSAWCARTSVSCGY